MKLAFIIFLFLLIRLSCAISVDIGCPKEVFPFSEFECDIEVENTTGIYDLKADISANGQRVAKIYNEMDKKWQSAYYYLKEFIDDDGEYKIKLNITSPIYEKIPASIKLRQGTKTYTFDFNIRLAEPQDAYMPASDHATINESAKEDIAEIKGEILNISTRDDRTKTIINQKGVVYEEEVIYESKNIRLKEYAIYGFCLILIFVIAVLLYEKNGKSSNDC
jgi:hypothetical protein